MTQRISVNPNPPVAGEPVKITYDFSGADITSARLCVSFFPKPNSSEQKATVANPTIEVEVPEDAEQITIEDKDGDSPDLVKAVDQQGAME